MKKIVLLLSLVLLISNSGFAQAIHEIFYPKLQQVRSVKNCCGSRKDLYDAAVYLGVDTTNGTMMWVDSLNWSMDSYTMHPFNDFVIFYRDYNLVPDQYGYNTRFDTPTDFYKKYGYTDEHITKTTMDSINSYNNAALNSKVDKSSVLTWSSPSSTGSRSFNTAYRESTTQIYNISVSTQISCNLSLSGGQAGTITLEISSNGTSGWIPVGVLAGSNTGTLTIGLNTTQITGNQLSYDVPATWYWRLTTNSTVGSPTYTYNKGVYKILQ